ncbi:hypothetical protein TW71_007880 [Vibrio coralliilyticus]|uniref:hypothetical protein n=1 Tax=Vibrio coralliilyticus TaxID=190893 RepID=UPI0006967CF3|nr:hypothetical protein [Vibrio coralliilyticus]QOU28567.1 hypothetical protein TW71_007880 [Vibrio coralliilyticus]
MKNFLSSVYTEMSGRLKTPLLGTFALCWLLYNHDHVAKLIFSDNTQRLALIEETPFYWMSDLVIPAALSLIYIFAIPFAQWIVDLAKYKLIEKRRVATQHGQLLEKYSGQMKVAQQQSKASLEYWQELHRNHAENAGKQILIQKEKAASLSMVIGERDQSIKTAEHNYANLQNTQQQLSEELSAKQSAFSDLEANHKLQLQKMEETFNKLEEIQNVIANLEWTNDIEYRNECRQTLELFDDLHKTVNQKTIAMNDVRQKLGRVSERASHLLSQPQNERDEVQTAMGKIAKSLSSIVPKTAHENNKTPRSVIVDKIKATEASLKQK